MKALSACLLLLACTSVQAGIAEHVTRAQGGPVDLIVYPTPIKDVVTIVGALPAGDALTGEGNAAVATLTGLMLDRGTRGLDKFSIARQLDDVGATIQFGVSNETLDIRARCLLKDLPLVLHLLALQLRDPAFDAVELEKARQQFMGELSTHMNSTNERARDAFNRAVFPAGHPNRTHSLQEFTQQVPKATLAEVQSFYRKVYGGSQLTLVVVGAAKPSVVEREVAREFRGWAGGVQVPRTAGVASVSGAETRDVPMPGKSSVSVLLGQATGLKYADPDTLSLRVGTAILGTGFTGRLMSAVRDREGLTYGIGAGLADDNFNDGMFLIAATFAPQLVDQGIASTRRELARWWRDGVTAEELARRKESIVGTYQVSLSTTAGLATALLLAVQRGLGVEWVDRYPAAVRALTLDQVNAAIRTHLDPDKMILVRAGTFGSSTTH